jgi:hypothetical protein
MIPTEPYQIEALIAAQREALEALFVECFLLKARFPGSKLFGQEIKPDRIDTLRPLAHSLFETRYLETLRSPIGNLLKDSLLKSLPGSDPDLDSGLAGVRSR